MEEKPTPDFVFETSWEVCNKVGGIYTVLSSHAKAMNSKFKNRLIFVGPDNQSLNTGTTFNENVVLLREWRKAFTNATGLTVRAGTWAVPGHPTVILVDYRPLFEKKNEIYSEMWEAFGVDSLHSYGDYDDSSLFGYAVGMIIEHFCAHHHLDTRRVIAHFHEWQTAFGEFYLKIKNPKFPTVFTTHATAIGRSIAEHEKPLYGCLPGFNGKQMAGELGLESKHSVEYTAAKLASCFTTVSDITAKECEQLLERKVDVVLPNGFEPLFVPQPMRQRVIRRESRKRMAEVAELILKKEIDIDRTMFIATSGRYEYKNKGINMFIDVLKKLNTRDDLTQEVIAFIMVPAYASGPRADLAKRLLDPYNKEEIGNSFCTYELYYPEQDPVSQQLRSFPNLNAPDQNVKVIFVPCYLDGNDHIFNLNYYDMVLGLDLTIFPSYYEPWGYTPLESVAFSIPTVTTDLSGFGLWVKGLSETLGIENGVVVAHRTDDNYTEVVDEIENEVHKFCTMPQRKLRPVKMRAARIAKMALWSNFIEHYYEAYAFALSKESSTKK